ncbi:hypothetical protein HPB51_022189 [Rhipicephalus microplus]|uniref:Dual specificity protein phosphatase n=1 Tax=Rhipicephalus microplus TaxID=6941 RepID=A0A9J6F938_RHIMP|nr:hypothetical protein HPB51_022189 [Rhipicephalus microplus]
MDDIRSFDVKSLRKVKTSVKTVDGRQFEEVRDSKGEPRIVSTPRFDGSMGFVPDLKPDLQHKDTIAPVPLYDNGLGSVLLFEARAGALRTLVRKQAYDGELVSVVCRACGGADETIAHIVTECPQLSPSSSNTDLAAALGFVDTGDVVDYAADAAADWCLLRSLAVTHVVNAVATTVPNFHEDRGLTYLALELLDLPDFTLTLDTIDKVCDFIDEALSSGGSVLVHCNAGVSRSCALVLAFLILRRGMDLREALERARTARPVVRPNDGFLRQLKELQKSVRPSTQSPSS